MKIELLYSEEEICESMMDDLNKLSDKEWEILDVKNIPPACAKCSNHPSNGGSGFCNCVLGTPSMY